MNDHISTRTLNWKELVVRSWGKDWTKPEIGYEFTNRKFNDRGRALSSDSHGNSAYADDYADDYA